MISTGLQEFYCSATIDYMESSSSLTVVMNSIQGEILTSEVCVSVKRSGESCKWQKTYV
jgi:hypothetical protein